MAVRPSAISSGDPREGGQDRARADAEEEDDDHPLAAPLVREPAGRNRGHPEGDEARRRVRDEGRVAHPPLVGEPEGRDRREDEHEEVVEEVPDVQEEEAEASTRHVKVSRAYRRPRVPPAGRGSAAANHGLIIATSGGRGISSRVRPCAAFGSMRMSHRPSWRGRRGATVIGRTDGETPAAQSTPAFRAVRAARGSTPRHRARIGVRGRRG